MSQPRNSHTVRVDPELWEWFHIQCPQRGAFPFFVNEVLRELREMHGERMAPIDAAYVVAKKLKREF